MIGDDLSTIVAPRVGATCAMTTPSYDYYLIENTYVARYDRETCRADVLMPDGMWVESMRTREICNGRPLEDEQDALDTASFLVARNKVREAAKRGETCERSNGVGPS
jgi:hypothetical protein